VNWPRHRGRYLAAMTLEKARASGRAPGAAAILPVGAIEQHGPHLPVGVDALLGQMLLDAALPLLREDAPVYVAPPIQIGKSNEHDGFPGSLSLSRRSLRALVRASAFQLRGWGFRRIPILNTHGGNTSALDAILRELALEEQEMDLALLPLEFEAELRAREAAAGIHAGELETSLLYAAAPHLTRPEAADCSWIEPENATGELRPEAAAATFGWKTLDLSRSGTMGDARAGSAEKGRAWLARAGRRLADRLERIVAEAPA